MHWETIEQSRPLEAWRTGRVVVREGRPGALAAGVREEGAVPEDYTGRGDSQGCCQDPG